MRERKGITSGLMSSIPRKSNIELFRILAMWGILILHCMGQGRVLDTVVPENLNYYLVWTLEAFCYASVNIFALFSGYFLVYGRFKVCKVLSLWMEIFFWSIVIFCIAVAIGVCPLDGPSLMKTLFPVIMRPWWYASCYLGLYLLSPFLRKGLLSLTQRQHAALVLVGLALFCLPYDTFNVASGYSLIWLVYLFCLAGYVRRFGLFVQVSTRALTLLWLVSSFSIAGFKFLLENAFPGTSYSPLLYGYNSLPCLVASVCVFLLVLRLTIPTSRAINIVAGSTFGVFLVHSHFAIRDILWVSLGSGAFAGAPPLQLLLFVMLTTLAVFVVCVGFELMRQKLFSMMGVSAFLDWIAETCSQQFDRLLIWLVSLSPDGGKE